MCLNVFINCNGRKETEDKTGIGECSEKLQQDIALNSPANAPGTTEMKIDKGKVTELLPMSLILENTQNTKSNKKHKILEAKMMKICF